MAKSNPTDPSILSKLKKARRIIKELRRELAEVKIDWAHYLFNLIDLEIKRYHVKLNPLPSSIKASYANKPLLYEVNVKDIIAIVSSQRVKTIYLSNEIQNTEGRLRKTNQIVVNRNKLTLEELCNEIESINFFLVQVTKNTCINIRYFSTDWQYIYINEKKDRLQTLQKIKIGKHYLSNFKNRKADFDDTVSLHNVMLQYKKRKSELL